MSFPNTFTGTPKLSDPCLWSNATDKHAVIMTQTERW